MLIPLFMIGGLVCIALGFTEFLSTLSEKRKGHEKSVPARSWILLVVGVLLFALGAGELL